MKALIIFFMVIGSYAGSCIPLIWGDSLLSMASLFFSAIGGFFGIWIGYKLGQRIGI
jgi:hypothetical protein